MSDVILCSVAGCSTRFKRAGKYPMYPAHSPCYVAGQYDTFGPPCFPCLSWLCCSLGLLEDKVECIVQLKAWVKRIIWHNKYLKLDVTASSGTVILDYLKARKGTVANTEPLGRRLNAIRSGIVGLSRAKFTHLLHIYSSGLTQVSSQT